MKDKLRRRENVVSTAESVRNTEVANSCGAGGCAKKARVSRGGTGLWFGASFLFQCGRLHRSAAEPAKQEVGTLLSAEEGAHMEASAVKLCRLTADILANQFL